MPVPVAIVPVLVELLVPPPMGDHGFHFPGLGGETVVLLVELLVPAPTGDHGFH